MGQPVVHFEVVGKDAKKLRDFYAELAGWNFDDPPAGPTEYYVLAREGNTNSAASESAAASVAARRDTRGT